MNGSKAQRLAGYLLEDADNLQLRADLADELIREGRPSEALEHIDFALRATPAHPQFRYRRAIALRHLGRVEEAIAVLEALIAEGFADPAVICALADARFGARDFEGVLLTLEKLGTAVTDPAIAAQADLLRVRTMHYLGRLDEAIDCARAALAARPAQAQLRAALATLLLDAERMTEAEQAVAEASAAGLVTPELTCVSGYLALGKEDSAAAQARFAETLKARPQDGRALLGAGLAAAALQDLPGALGRMQAAAQAMPGHLGTLNALAWMQVLSGQLDAAEGTFRQALEADRNFAETHGGLAVVAALRGEAAAAQELVRTAQRLDRNSFSAAYAAMLLRNGSQPNQQTTEAMLQFLAQQPAPGGGSLKDLVLRQARRLAAP
jgi:tetratricopeptide (TPR) repeat protein